MRLLRWLVLAALFGITLVPLVIAPTHLFPYVTGKAYFFRCLVIVAGAGWLALVAFGRARLRLTPVLGAFALVLLTLGLADARSPAPEIAFWSTVDRRNGWVELAYLGAFLLVATQMLTPALWRRWFVAWLIASLLVALYAALQMAGVIVLTILTPIGAWIVPWPWRFGLQLEATLGNPSYLGAYAAFNVLLACYFLRRPCSSTVKQPSRKRPIAVQFRAWAPAVFIAANLFLLYMSGSRGAMLALVVGGIMGLALTGRWRLAVIAAVPLTLAAAIPLLLPPDWVAWDLTLTRLHNTSFLEEKDRLLVWRDALELIRLHPWLGWGQDGMRLGHMLLHPGDGWYLGDRAHNLLLDWLVSGGLLGAEAYTLLLGAGFLAIWGSANDRAGKAILTGAFMAYLVADCFVFDTLTSYLGLVAVLGYASVDRDAARLAGRIDDDPAARGARDAAERRAGRGRKRRW